MHTGTVNWDDPEGEVEDENRTSTVQGADLLDEKTENRAITHPGKNMCRP